MRVKTSLAFFLYLFAFCFLSCSSPTSNNKKSMPTTPKPAATIDFKLLKSPDITFDFQNAIRHIENTAIVTSTNNVGGTISNLIITWFEGNNTVANSSHNGGSFVAYGTLNISFNSSCDGRYEPDKVTFQIKGTDNNGYSIDRTLTYTYIWNSLNRAVLIK